MAFKEIKGSGGGAFFKWDAVGKSITGRYVGIFDGKVLNGRQTKYLKFVLADGTEIKANVTTVLLDRFTARTKGGALELNPGDMLRVTYTHDEKGNQPQPVKVFRIEKDEIGAPETPAPAPAPQAPPQQAAPQFTPEQMAAAMALLQGGNGAGVAAPPQVSEYERLLGILRTSNPKGADAIKGALEMMYASEEERTAKLKQTLQQQGVAA